MKKSASLQRSFSVTLAASSAPDDAAGADALQELTNRVHLPAEVAEGGGANAQRFDDGKLAAGFHGIGIQLRAEGAEALHHPVTRVLRQAAQERLSGMHVRIDEPGQNHVAGGVETSLGHVALQQLTARAGGDDATTVDCQPEVRLVPDAVSSQREKREDRGPADRRSSSDVSALVRVGASGWRLQGWVG
jgi:hypothetical protein